MVTGAAPVVPAPGEAALPAPDGAALLRRNAVDPAIAIRPAVLFDDHRWTHGEYVAESARWAAFFRAHAPAEGRLHVGVLLDNTPDYLFALGGAALSGATVVGLNHTRTGEHLRRDIAHTDVGLIVTEPGHLADLAPVTADLDIGPVVVSHRYPVPGQSESDRDLGTDLDDALADAERRSPPTASRDPDPDRPWVLVFTSGTSAAPKAVICSHRRLLVTGVRMGLILGLGPADVGYVCMPLFHSNALMVGWAPSLVHGCAVALARRFSVSAFLPDVRRYGATYFNYTGKPLSYLVASSEQPDDGDNPLRVAFGNEGSPQVVERFGRRFDVEVIDAFGSTEGGISVQRAAPPRPGAVGVAGPNVLIVDEHGAELPPARFDHGGRLLNAEECVGEIVNVVGAGPFEGYYNNPEATARATRNGWYWSGDLGYLDADRFLYFAGRTADWLRVDGENFPAEPIASAIAAHPDVVVAAVYGVPDIDAGDQVMAAIVLREGAVFDPEGFAAWVDGPADLGPKWRPRYVRVAESLPSTGTNKVVTRALVHEKFRSDRTGGDAVWVRERGEASYRSFTPADEAALRTALTRAGRQRFWDL